MTYSSKIPFRMKLGEEPVIVPVPPKLDEYAVAKRIVLRKFLPALEILQINILDKMLHFRIDVKEW